MIFIHNNNNNNNNIQYVALYFNKEFYNCIVQIVSLEDF